MLDLLILPKHVAWFFFLSIIWLEPKCLIIQVTGTVKTVNIDKTDGCMMYLSKESVNANIVTAKSSEMNILVPDDSGEFVSSENQCIN